MKANTDINGKNQSNDTYTLVIQKSDFEYEGKLVIAISVKADGKIYTTTDGRCLKRLGRNSKPAYPDELSAVYSSVQNPDFSGRIIGESTLDDVNKLEVYSLKEKLRVRDSKSTLPDLEDIEFLRDRVGLDNLPENLREMAFLRLEYPEATLKELGGYLDPPVGKSGVNHRLRKLSAMAEDLR